MPSQAAAALWLAPGRYDYTGVSSAKYNGQAMTPAAMLDALSRDLVKLVDQIPAVPDPVSGSARIVIPDHDRLRVLVAQRLPRLNAGAYNLLVEQDRIGLHLIADVVQRSRVLGTVSIAEQNDTVSPDTAGAGYLLWYQVRSVTPTNVGPWIGRWQLKRNGTAVSSYVGIDPGTPAGAPRMMSFVKSIQLAAANPASATADAIAGTGRHPFSSGSGMVVDGQGHVMTNDHVIANCPDMHVVDAGGTDATAKLVAGDAADDLALVKTDRHFANWARFRGSHALHPGEPLVVTGFPLPGLVSPEMAVTTGSLTTLAGPRGDSRQLQFSAPIQPGNSGGPVLDESGRVVGIASSMLNGIALAALTGALPQNINFAVKSDTAREFAAANQVALDDSAGRGGLTASAVGDLARKFTVRVECYR